MIIKDPVKFSDRIFNYIDTVNVTDNNINNSHECSEKEQKWKKESGK